MQRDYKSVFMQADKTNEPMVVMSNNDPLGFIVSMKKMQEYLELQNKQLLWDTISSIQSKNRYNDPIETQKDIDQAVKEARKKVYEETFGSIGQQRNSKRHATPPKRTR